MCKRTKGVCRFVHLPLLSDLFNMEGDFLTLGMFRQS